MIESWLLLINPINQLTNQLFYLLFHNFPYLCRPKTVPAIGAGGKE